MKRDARFLPLLERLTQGLNLKSGHTWLLSLQVAAKA